MKLFITLVLLNTFFAKNIIAKNFIYESSFFDINIVTENISDDKTYEIEKIKNLSLVKILKYILDNNNIKKINNKVDLRSEVNFLIRNINIENEFISKKQYSAKIKINFDYNEIIELLRKHKVNYSDIESDNLLLLAYEDKPLVKFGLSKNNSFYKKINKKYGLINFKIPDLSLNDRFILPYNKIEKINIDKLSKISQKYSTNYAIVVNFKNDNLTNFLTISIYSLKENKIVYRYNFKNLKNQNYEDKFITVIDNWWKTINFIDNSIINKETCIIKNSNIHELYFIISKIEKISQIKSIRLININLGKNIYEIIYYGDFPTLSIKLKKNKILNEIDSKNNCSLFLTN